MEFEDVGFMFMDPTSTKSFIIKEEIHQRAEAFQKTYKPLLCGVQAVLGDLLEFSALGEFQTICAYCIRYVLIRGCIFHKGGRGHLFIFGNKD